MSARFVLACSALATVVLAAAAGDQSSDHPPPVVARGGPTTVERPAVALSSRLAAPEPDCNPLANLRPQNPLPEPGHMPPGSTMARITERGQLVIGIGQGTYRSLSGTRTYGRRDSTSTSCGTSPRRSWAIATEWCSGR
jgi:polar amino acid transport system substrate-binding protein